MSTTTSTAGTSVFRHSIVSLFAAGFISVLLFQMGALAILNAIGFPGAGAPFPYGVTKPMNVPQIWSFAFWGGMWGIVFGALERRFPEGHHGAWHTHAVHLSRVPRRLGENC